MRQAPKCLLPTRLPKCALGDQNHHFSFLAKNEKKHQNLPKNEKKYQNVSNHTHGNLLNSKEHNNFYFLQNILQKEDGKKMKVGYKVASKI